MRNLSRISGHFQDAAVPLVAFRVIARYSDAGSGLNDVESIADHAPSPTNLQRALRAVLLGQARHPRLRSTVRSHRDTVQLGASTLLLVALPNMRSYFARSSRGGKATPSAMGHRTGGR